MKLRSTGLLLIALPWLVHCTAEDREYDPALGDASSATGGTGGSSSSGGTSSLGGSSAVDAGSDGGDSGDSSASGGTSASGGALAGGGNAGAGGIAGAGGVSSGITCSAVEQQASTTPLFVGWEEWQGKITTCAADTAPWCEGETEVSFDATGAEAAVTLLLGSWTETGRTCLDVSSYTGVKFSLEGDTAVYGFAVSVAGTHTDYCAESNCNAHPRKMFAPPVTGAVEVPFGELMPPDWAGVDSGADFNPEQVISLHWFVTTGSTITIKNVEFY